MKKIFIILLCLSLTLVFVSCKGGDDVSTPDIPGAPSLVAVSGETKPELDIDINIDTSAMFSKRDNDSDYDIKGATVVFSEGGVSSSSSDVVISGGAATIRSEGTYIISGSTSDGQLVVDTPKDAKIQLVLNGASICCKTSAAIYVRSADKVFLTTVNGTENSLSNGGSYVQTDSNNVDACIFSKSDLSINGMGVLSVDAKAGHGIVSKSDLAVTGGEIKVVSQNHALSAKDSVRISGGSLSLTSGKDGIHADCADKAGKGFVYINGGNINIKASGDGISATDYLLIEGGYFDISCSGNSSSMKGLKSKTDIFVTGGEMNIDSADDAIHATGNAKIAGGSLAVKTGDDALHAGGKVVISNGKLDIQKSYEGIEGTTIYITGGETHVVATDDGLNVAGGNDSSGFGGAFGGDMFAQEGVEIYICGGYVYVNVSGDGIDSNGDLTVTGGVLFVSGPTNSGNGALDYNGSAKVTGGIVIAAGSIGMAENFGQGSTQGSMLVNIQGAAGSKITLLDASGKELISYSPEKQFGCVVISCPEIKQGQTYTVKCGSNSMQVTMTDIIYGGTNGFGGMGGPGGGRPGNPGGPGAKPPR